MPGRALREGFPAEALASAVERRIASSEADKSPIGDVLTSCLAKPGSVLNSQVAVPDKEIYLLVSLAEPPGQLLDDDD